MSNSYSLAQLREDVDREFAPLTFDLGDDTVVLQSAMRLDDKDRLQVQADMKLIQTIQNSAEETEEDQVPALKAAVFSVLEKVTADKKGKKLVAALDGDLALGMMLMNKWGEATMPGEASNSPA